MIDDVQKTIVLGGLGAMAQLLLPHLPRPTTLIDIKTLEKTDAKTFLLPDRTVRRLSSSELKAVSKYRKQSGRIGSLCILSIPNEIYQRAASRSGDSKLSDILGVSGRGYSSTLFVHQTSVHSIPSEVLESISGVVLGVHLLHSPKVAKSEKETAIVTASGKKRLHDRYGSGYEILNCILHKRMGYKHVFQMDPARHDTIMANIQFLTHSMLLILGDSLLSNKYKITPNNYHKLPSSILILLGRMKKQRPHVYKGIATGNRYNEIVIKEIRNLSATYNGADPDWLRSALGRFGDIRDRIVEETGMSERERERICTPMSRVRDGLVSYARSRKAIPSDKAGVDIRPFIDKYLAALSSGYDKYFEDIMLRLEEKLKVLDFETLTMDKFEALR